MTVKGTKISSWLWDLLGNLPLIVPASLAVFSSVVVVSLLSFGLKGSIVWPVGLVLSLIPAILIWKHSKEKLAAKDLKRRRLIDLLVLIGITLWVVFNMFFAAHDVFITRDPGIYTVTGQWLTQHEKTDIKTPPIVIQENGLANYSGGIWLTTTPDKSILQPQGMHLLPALLGLAGKIFGPNGIFKANIFFGGLALLSFYGFARLVMKNGWAAISTLVLAVSLPFIYFSRHTYTEIIALAFTFGSLSVLWLAQTKAKTDKKLWLWMLAGFVGGAGTLVRPDAYLNIVAVSIYLVVVLTLAGPKDKGIWLKRVVSYLLAAAIPAVIAQLDLRMLTHSYYLETKRDIRIQLALLAAVLVFGTIATILSKRTEILSYLDKRTKNWRGWAAGVAIISGLFLLMLRPVLLYSIHHGSNNTGDLYGYSVRNQTTFNTSPKLVIDHTMDWISWYIGLPLLLLGFVGMAIAASKVMRDRTVKLLPFLMMVGLTIMMYGAIPRITLDQIWAIRRFLPVILPGLIIFGFFALDYILSKVDIEARLKKTIAIFAALFIILIPLTVTRPFLFVKENRNNYNYVTSLCSMFPKNAQVIWLGSALELDSVHTTRTYCGNYTLGYNYKGKKGGQLNPTDMKNIAAINKAANRPTILIVRTSLAEQLIPANREKFTKVLDYKAQQLELSFDHAPLQAIDVSDSFEIAMLNDQGQLVRYQP